jgi:hypothetical protein
MLYDYTGELRYIASLPAIASKMFLAATEKKKVACTTLRWYYVNTTAFFQDYQQTDLSVVIF